MGTTETATKDKTTLILWHDRADSVIPAPMPTAGKIAGNSTLCAMYTGAPSELKVAIETLEDAFAATNTLVKPATVQIIAAMGDIGAAAEEKLKRSSPVVDMNAVEMVMLEGLMLEQLAAAAVDFMAENCKPDIDMNLMKLELSEVATVNETVKETLGGRVT
jgi:hypothetical protein